MLSVDDFKHAAVRGDPQEIKQYLDQGIYLQRGIFNKGVRFATTFTSNAIPIITCYLAAFLFEPVSHQNVVYKVFVIVPCLLILD